MPRNSHDDTCSLYFPAFFKPINAQAFSSLVVCKVYIVLGFHTQLQEPLLGLENEMLYKQALKVHPCLTLSFCTFVCLCICLFQVRFCFKTFSVLAKVWKPTTAVPACSLTPFPNVGSLLFHYVRLVGGGLSVFPNR